MLEHQAKKGDAIHEDSMQKEQIPKPRIRSARTIRTLVMTALAALPMKACTAARQAPPERPRDGVTAAEDAGTAVPDDGDSVGAPAPDRAGGEPEAREPPGPDASGRVWRGGGERDAGPEPADEDAQREDEDRSGRVWRGAPGEDRHEGDRDAWEPDDARRRRDYVPPPIPPYGVAPVPEYGVPEPIVRPMYGVEPPPPVAEYAVPAPDDDGLGPVLRYGLPYPR
ncbi:MAG: hypothetical protein GYA57_11085 [Myxococcales bacterium]|nr:hypothetical protein [Myxococcales bacterium]